MFNKKGINPVIATILLVSFAVAIGVSFVSFAGSYVENKSTNKASDCKEYILDFFELDSTKQLCQSKFRIPFSMKFWYKDKPKPETDCYVNIASGTSRICSVKSNLTEKTWAPSNEVNT